MSRGRTSSRSRWLILLSVLGLMMALLVAVPSAGAETTVYQGLWAPTDPIIDGTIIDGSATELGVTFTTSEDILVTGVRFHKRVANTGIHTGTLWNADTGLPVATGTFVNETSSGWQDLLFAVPVMMGPGDVYVASYFAPNGNYSYEHHYFDDPLTVGPVTALGDGDNDVYLRGTGFPINVYMNTNYWVTPIWNRAPIADAGVSSTGTFGTPVTFDGSGSFDPEGADLTYDWYFGDGQTGTGIAPPHTYAVEGSYTVTLTVTDPDGLSDTDTAPVTIGVNPWTTLGDCVSGEVFVNSTSGTPQPSQTPLTAGNLYGITARGTYYAGGTGGVTDIQADAKYSQDRLQRAAGEEWTDLVVHWSTDPTLLELFVGADATPEAVDDWGAYNDEHTYTIEELGSGTPLEFRFWIYDTWPGNNVGGLCVSTDLLSAPPTADPNGPYVETLGVGIVFDGTGSSDPDADDLTYDWGFGDGGTATGVAPTHTYGSAGIYDVCLTVTDTYGLTDTACTTARVNTPPNADANGPYTVDEGSPVTLNGSGSTDPDGDDIVLYEWDLENDGTYDVSSFNPTTSHTYPDGPLTRIVVLRVTDQFGATDTVEATVNVGNVAPTVATFAVPPIPIPVGTPVPVTTTFSDPAGALDVPYTCEVDYGEADETGSVSGFECSSSHVYSEAGIYSISVSVTDKDGGVGTAMAEASVVVYDPSEGFVTGGGWVYSEAGNYQLDLDLEGKATFGFISKYKKGATVPTGNTEFQFHAGDLNFHSSSYDWLVVTGGPTARFKGTGTIDGMGGEYKFMITAGDAEQDTFRIKIWSEDGVVENLVYDNKDNEEIGGGSIIIHAPKK